MHADSYSILRDVEAKTVRLNEHGKDVLVLEKVLPIRGTPAETVSSIPHRHIHDIHLNYAKLNYVD